jgi:acetaldehyde dehydrogenase
MRLTAAVVGSGNIGSDLLVKLCARGVFDVRYMVGIDEASPGLRRARKLGVETSAEGVEWLLTQATVPDVVFEATSAKAHQEHAPFYAARGVRAIDLTPAAVGPLICPVVNGDTIASEPNINMITCGGQATIPIVHAVSRVVEVEYAEIVATIASRSAGPGTRANIDEFTETTAAAIRVVGGARRGKAIIILNPVEPPMIMRDTVFCSIPPNANRHDVVRSIEDMVASVRTYVPGYTLRAAPQFDDPRPEWQDNGRVAIFLEVFGNGDFLPSFAGNLDIMTAAAARAGELIAVMA